nr:hypothetical protein [Pseudomonas alkylphenolica]
MSLCTYPLGKLSIYTIKRHDLHAQIDCQHYLSRQLQPVADAILPFDNDDFSRLTGRQLLLF